MDIIMSRMQNTVLSDIDMYLMLSKRRSDNETLQELWLGILAYMESEPERYPPALLPSTYWKGKTIFKNRGTTPMIRLYLHQVASYLDAMKSKNLPR
jgi:hypothetical protein